MAPVLLLAGNASDWTGPTGTNTFLLTGAVPALIDAGIGHPAHLSALAERLGGAALSTILVTHGHPDHAGGLPALLDRWPSARIVRFPDVSEDSVEVVGDEVRLRPLHTPGHSPDHLCFLDEAAGDLYCGDLVRSGGTVVIPASHGGNLREYLQSLRRVQAIGPRRLLPGHGPIVDDPASLIDRYLQHRDEREAQVVAALSVGLTTPAQMAERIYDTLAPGLMPAAADSVLAHLVKLEEEGRASIVDDRWRLV